MCPPTATISSGFSRPGRSPITFAESTSASIRAPISSRTLTGTPSRYSRWSSPASSGVIDAAGIFGKPAAYSNDPVCGVCSASGVTARTSTAAAPSAAARDGPADRYCTESP